MLEIEPGPTDDGLRQRQTYLGLAGLVDSYLQPQYAQLARNDRLLRDGENVTHETRVAIRRIRSTLRVFDTLFEPTRAAHLDTSLKWYADLLGTVRDLDIATARVERQLDDIPDELPSDGASEDLI